MFSCDGPRSRHPGISMTTDLKADPRFNILMYSHDTYGLGHIRRTMAIADKLTRPDTNILILTGSPMAGRLRFPDNVDYVRIPGMIKRTNDDYFPLAIRIHPRHAMEIRQSIIMATVTSFQPDLLIVDKEPLGLRKEVLPALEWIRENLPNSRTVLGLRDIMDDAETVIRDWQEKQLYQAMEELYSEIWVYGRQDFYDPVSEYRIPPSIAEKLHFTGYIPRRRSTLEETEAMRSSLNVMRNENLITVTTGGGGDGFLVLHCYLTMLEKLKADSMLPPFKSILLTGPFLSQAEKDEVNTRAAALGIDIHEFFSEMETLLSASDLVVCMGGYNTVCEVLSLRRVSLVIPRETPRKEQYIRANALKRNRLADFISWHDVSADLLLEKIVAMLEHRQVYENAMAEFQMDGISTICNRVDCFRFARNCR